MSLNVQKDNHDILIYYTSSIAPSEWTVGGKVSGCLTNCIWKKYNDSWEFAPAANSWDWANLDYTAPLTQNVTIASSGYSSFSSTYAVTIPTGITAYYATGVDGNKVTMTEVEGDVIPANEGVILKGEASPKYTFTETVSNKSFENNMLVAVSERIEGLAPEVTIDDVTYKNYVFTQGQFHPFTSDAIVNVGAGKAYLQIKKPADPNAKLEMSFDGGASGIETVLSTRTIDNNAIYNLRGERVNTMVKGNVYIVAGKKYLMK